mgnify:CR=1 FL=1
MSRYTGRKRRMRTATVVWTISLLTLPARGMAI